ncbi:MAG TPA: hypothetical protein VK461_06330 [Acidimicrobiales bacterium]|nr:hypothetical protein [Acidimicrobiales bacterium]
MEAQQREALYATKLSALVGAPAEPVRGGAAAVDSVGTAWFLAEDGGARALGPAFAWAEQHGASTLSLIVPLADSGVVARRAALFRDPPSVFVAEGRELVAAVPAPPSSSLPIPDVVADLVQLIVDAGADPVVEHGVLTGEVAGLEVLRAVVDPATGEPRLDVGLSTHDRDANQLVFGNVPPVSAIVDVVESVRAHREAGAPPHALNRVASSRLLRHRLLQAPELAGARELIGAPPPVPIEDRNAPAPAVATGMGVDGESVVVVCSVGIDLDLVPFAADARLALDPRARLLLALAPRDVHPVTQRIADRLVDPAEIVAVSP